MLTRQLPIFALETTEHYVDPLMVAKDHTKLVMDEWIENKPMQIRDVQEGDENFWYVCQCVVVFL